MAFNRKISFFKGAVRLLSTAQHPASLSVYVWHSGLYTEVDAPSFQRRSQKQLVSQPDDNAIKIPHAAFELNIDFTHPGVSKNIKDIMRSFIAETEKNILVKKGLVLSLDDQQEILARVKEKPLNSMSVYISLFPNIASFRQENFVGKMADVERKVFSDKSPGDYWTPLLLGKLLPSLVSKDSDFIPQKMNILEAVTLYDLDYEAILLDLSKLIFFQCDDNGYVTVGETVKEMRYYMLDLLRDHAGTNEVTDIKPEHVCSTVTSRILKKGLGESVYKSAVQIAKKKVGHGFALPDLVIEVAKQAKEEECKVGQEKNTDKSLGRK